MLAGDTAGGDCHKTRKFHESIIHAAIFLKKTLCQIVTPVLLIRLGDSFKTLPTASLNQNITCHATHKCLFGKECFREC